MAKRPTKPRGVNLTSLRQALVVAEHSSIRSAARALRVPESIVSRRMQTLERELGVPMFVRLQSGVRLTTAGRVILGRVREFVSQLEDSTRQARALAREVISRIRIGILSSI